MALPSTHSTLTPQGSVRRLDTSSLDRRHRILTHLQLLIAFCLTPIGQRWLSSSDLMSLGDLIVVLSDQSLSALHLALLL